MRAVAGVWRDAGGLRWRDSAPVVVRPTGPDAVHLVQAAGGPLGGDDLRLDVTLGPGARLRAGSVGATVVQPGTSGDPARWLLAAELAAGAELRWLPEPTVICAAAEQHSELRVRLAEGARLVARELVVLGRCGETGGRYRGLLAVDVAGEPLLRNESVVDGADAVLSGPAGTGGHRVFGCLLVAGTDADPPRLPDRWAPGVRAATLPLAGPGFLVLALGSTVAPVRAALNAALAAADPRPAGAPHPSRAAEPSNG